MWTSRTLGISSVLIMSSYPVSRHHRISNLAPHPRQQLDFAGAFINVLVSRYWRWKVHKIFYDLCHHLSASYLDRRLSTRVSAWPGLTSPVRWHGDTGLHAAVCYRLFLLSQPAAATIVLTTIKVISQFVRGRGDTASASINIVNCIIYWWTDRHYNRRLVAI